mmetsp:Transcript_25447/g.50060  ORF Transcript_25447/g.50060 Transcript_25447/m.50060 type:complete len:137 (+) Transcript_25447:2525-2935(+)
MTISKNITTRRLAAVEARRDTNKWYALETGGKCRSTNNVNGILRIAGLSDCCCKMPDTRKNHEVVVTNTISPSIVDTENGQKYMLPKATIFANASMRQKNMTTVSVMTKISPYVCGASWWLPSLISADSTMTVEEK